MLLWLVISQWGTASISESKSSHRQEPFVETRNPPLVLVVSWNLLFIRSPRVSVPSLEKLPFRTVLFSEQTLVLFSINSIFFFSILKFFGQISLPSETLNVSMSPDPIYGRYIYIFTLYVLSSRPITSKFRFSYLALKSRLLFLPVLSASPVMYPIDLWNSTTNSQPVCHYHIFSHFCKKHQVPNS